MAAMLPTTNTSIATWVMTCRVSESMLGSSVSSRGPHHVAGDAAVQSCSFPATNVRLWRGGSVIRSGSMS